MLTCVFLFFLCECTCVCLARGPATLKVTWYPCILGPLFSFSQFKSSLVPCSCMCLGLSFSCTYFVLKHKMYWSSIVLYFYFYVVFFTTPDTAYLIQLLYFHELVMCCSQTVWSFMGHILFCSLYYMDDLIKGWPLGGEITKFIIPFHHSSLPFYSAILFLSTVPSSESRHSSIRTI